MNAVHPLGCSSISPSRVSRLASVYSMSLGHPSNVTIVRSLQQPRTSLIMQIFVKTLTGKTITLEVSLAPSHPTATPATALPSLCTDRVARTTAPSPRQPVLSVIVCARKCAVVVVGLEVLVNGCYTSLFVVERVCACWQSELSGRRVERQFERSAPTTLHMWGHHAVTHPVCCCRWSRLTRLRMSRQRSRTRRGAFVLLSLLMVAIRGSVVSLLWAQAVPCVVVCSACADRSRSSTDDTRLATNVMCPFCRTESRLISSD